MDNRNNILKKISDKDLDLIEKITTKEVWIGVVGLGYVGLPLTLTFCEAGFRVVGFDIDENKIDTIRSNKSYISTIQSDRIANCTFYPTSNFSILENMDVIIITVPTPLNEYRQPDLSYVRNVVNQLKQYLCKNQLIILESTSYPGTTREEICNVIQKATGKVVGRDYFVAFSPERENPGSKIPIKQIPKLVSGITKKCLERVQVLYQQVFDKVIPVDSVEIAETAKILENTYRAVNIALINEMRYLCEQMGIDIWKVVEAASTKPFGFQKFTPGFVGGHCLDGKSKLFLIENKEHKIVDFGPYVDSLNCRKEIVNNTEFFYPENTKCLSFNISDKSITYEKVNCFSKRKFIGNMIDINCHYGYSLRVSDLHPMLIEEKGIQIKYAKDIKSGDLLILNKNLPKQNFWNSMNLDILEYLDPSVYPKVRVKLKTGSFKDYKDTIKKKIGNLRIAMNYFISDYLPLEKYLELEKDLNIPRSNLYLCRGSGPSFSKFPCIIFVDKDFARLIGYYLSEGCVLNNGDSLKTAFTFNSTEFEYIEDVVSILKTKFELKPLVFKDKNFKATCIRIPSYFLGFLFENILKCGKNCYEKQIPALFYNASSDLKFELLSGLFRGDGGSYIFSGKQKDAKGRIYNKTSASINYFTSSPNLFQQIGLLLKDFGVIPKIQKRDGLLSLSGPEDLENAKKLFGEIRKSLFETYFNNLQKRIIYDYVKDYGNYYALKVKDIMIEPSNTFVYSAEIENNHTIITSNGLIVHNCISTDPTYLTYRVKKFECKSRLISEAEAINWGQPKYIATKICEILGRHILLPEANILILGVTYKPDIDDIRESGVLRLMDYLEEKGLIIDYNDPYIPILKRDGDIFKTLHSYSITPRYDNLCGFETIIIAVNHSCYNYEAIVSNSKRVVDITNATREIRADNVYRI
jgi:UDP-N-acetyl-D-mannosaminuronate dehydrogenase